MSLVIWSTQTPGLQICIQIDALLQKVNSITCNRFIDTDAPTNYRNTGDEFSDLVNSDAWIANMYMDALLQKVNSVPGNRCIHTDAQIK